MTLHLKTIYISTVAKIVGFIMVININSKFGLRCANRRKLFSSLIVMLLTFSLFIGTFAGYAEGQSTVHVSTETELREAVSNAATGVSVIIVLDRDIGLTGSTLAITANKDITLRSNGNAEFVLFGAANTNTVTVENRGVLRLVGVTIAHVSGASGVGAVVNSGGTLFMTGGKISGNSGRGVFNSGNFTMTGGVISNNGDYGVYITGANSNFTMSGGEISTNGNGVYLTTSSANFNLTGGKISGNTGIGADIAGGTFTMSGGEISNNARGVDNRGTFTMSNGKIFANTIVNNHGGGVYNTGTFTMSGGEISNNVATNNYNGGGVVNSGTFTMSGGEISKNTASNGGGVYVSNGNFNLNGGKITGNTATRNGGGVWVTDTVTNFNRLTVRDGVVFSDNRALAAYNRAPEHDSIYRAYIGDNVQWSESFTQGYNNFDISYVYGTSITLFTVTVNDAYGTPTGAGSYSVGSTVTLNAGTRNGYNFNRWTVNSGGVTLSSTTSATATFTMPTNNVAVTASWNVIQYNIRYTLNSGSNAAGNPTTYNAGNIFPIAIGNPTRANYDFRGWNVTYANGTSTNFQVSYSIPAGTIGNIDLSANWATTVVAGPTGTPGSGGGSGGGSSGSDSGGTGSSNGGDSGNNNPHNQNDNSHNSDDNRQNAGNNDPPEVSTAGIVGSVIMTLGLVVLIGAFFANRVDSKVKKVRESTNEIEKNPGLGKLYLFTFVTAFYYLIYAEKVSIEKLNVMSRSIGNNRDLAFSAKFFAGLWTFVLSSVLFFISFIFINGFLLNTAGYAAIFSLDFAAFIEAFIGGTLGFISIINLISPIGFFCAIMLLLLALFGILNANNRVYSITDRLCAIAEHYYYQNRRYYYGTEIINFDIMIKKLREPENSGIFGLEKRLAQNMFASAKLIKCHNDSNRFNE